MTPARRGSPVAATWLIGLGLVFLVADVTDPPWEPLWPVPPAFRTPSGAVATMGLKTRM